MLHNASCSWVFGRRVLFINSIVVIISVIVIAIIMFHDYGYYYPLDCIMIPISTYNDVIILILV